MKRKTAKLVTVMLFGLTIASAQQRQIWEDETKTIFRGRSLELGMGEQEFAQRFPGGFKSSVETDLREPGSLPTVYVNGEWRLLDPKLTTKEHLHPEKRRYAGR